MNLFNRFLKDESGATAIEYALIAAIIGVGIVIALGPLRDSITGAFTKIKGELDTAIPAKGS